MNNFKTLIPSIRHIGHVGDFLYIHLSIHTSQKQWPQDIRDMLNAEVLHIPHKFEL